MSLYREPGSRRRTTVVLAAVAAIVLLAIGYGIGRATAPEPSLQSQLADLREDAMPVANALELVPIHYESSNETTREAAGEQLARAEDLFAGIEKRLMLVDAARTRDAQRAIGTVARLVSEGAAPARVETAAQAAERAVREAAG